jgi:hypothetical protein
MAERTFCKNAAAMVMGIQSANMIWEGPSADRRAQSKAMRFPALEQHPVNLEWFDRGQLL